jgi:hypothetical protein
MEVAEEVSRSDDCERAEEERGDDSVEGRSDQAEGSGVQDGNVVGLEGRGRGVEMEVELEDFDNELDRESWHVERSSSLHWQKRIRRDRS